MNVGLRNVPPPIWENNLDNFQAVPSIPGVNRVGKGYNEYVLYGESSENELLAIKPAYYYFYVGMTWDNGEEGLITTDGYGKGLFFKNYVLGYAEGFFCTRNNEAYFKWDCESTMITEFNFRPEESRMPSDREITSWWECGAEDYNTYTQLQCRSQQVPESEERDFLRVSYDAQMNLEFWGLSFTTSELEWVYGGEYVLKGAYNSLKGSLFTAASVLALATFSSF